MDTDRRCQSETCTTAVKLLRNISLVSLATSRLLLGIVCFPGKTAKKTFRRNGQTSGEIKSLWSLVPVRNQTTAVNEVLLYRSSLQNYFALSKWLFRAYKRVCSVRVLEVEPSSKRSTTVSCAVGHNDSAKIVTIVVAIMQIIKSERAVIQPHVCFTCAHLKNKSHWPSSPIQAPFCTFPCE